MEELLSGEFHAAEKTYDLRLMIYDLPITIPAPLLAERLGKS
jgi:hypothetical protein